MKIEIVDLTKSYGDIHALNGISITLKEGIYGLLGPNGAGKSTMFGLLTDQIRRDGGQILCDGTEILKMGAQYRALLGYMPQQQEMYGDYSAIAFLRYMAALKGVKHTEGRGQIEKLLHQVNLWEVRNRKIKSFSGGMKQRLLLAQALLGNPKLIILDEPTAGLDPGERVRIRNYIAELSKDRIILYATHVVSDIESIADDIVLLKKGQIVAQGSLPELIQRTEEKLGRTGLSLEDVFQIFCES